MAMSSGPAILTRFSRVGLDSPLSQASCKIFDPPIRTDFTHLI